MESNTSEFSFVLKPSSHGIGVFSTHLITKGTELQLWSDTQPRTLEKKSVPQIFHQYCADRGDTLLCPNDFSMMPVGYYLNHSKDANAVHSGWLEKEGGYRFYAKNDIKEGEEITIDYNTLEEPDSAKEDYYRH